MDRDMQRLTREVHDLWRDEVARAAAADARHRPRDTFVKVQVVQPFRVNGREVAAGAFVEVEKWLVSGLIAQQLAEKV